MQKLRPFHLAIPVTNLERCRIFYNQILNCEEGRNSENWVDFNFYGHQLVIHKKKGEQNLLAKSENPVDGHDVPIPHFGVILDWKDWEDLADRLKANDTKFIIEPYIRFEGKTGEQATMFFQDPDGNSLEFKAFKNDSEIFRKD